MTDLKRMSDDFKEVGVEEMDVPKNATDQTVDTPTDVVFILKNIEE